MRHVNIPIFIPHLGCPNQCVFCNQRSISGVDSFKADDVTCIIDNALSTIESDAEVEIAFFGGSFTGIDRNLMISLLEIGHSYILKGRVHSLRCSTRPDYINEEIISILKKYGVKTVELGLQSSSDKVLSITKRGHNFDAEKQSCKLIVDSGMNLVGQMMIGLPMSDLASEIECAKFIIDSGAVGARIYPTVVFRDTELYDMSINGSYKPLTVDEAVKRSAKILDLFVEHGVEVIRIGLQSGDGLSDTNKYYSGPNHPALGELVISELYYNRIQKLIEENISSKEKSIIIYIPRGAMSKAVGQNKRNKNRLLKSFNSVRFVESDKLKEYSVLVETYNGENKCT